MKIITPNYKYNATIVSIHDGDTCALDVDLNQKMRGQDKDYGFHLYCVAQKLRIRGTFRFFGINAPELSTQAGRDALVFIKKYISVGMKVTVYVIKGDAQEKYGRWLAIILLPEGKNLNQMMVDTGHAVAYAPSLSHPPVGNINKFWANLA